MSKIKDGDLHKTFEIDGVRFDIYYGYDTEAEKLRGWEPTPLYPDFDKSPQYTDDGIPFTLAYGGPCDHFNRSDKNSEDDWCANCTMFERREEFIGLCKCPMNQINKNE